MPCFLLRAGKCLVHAVDQVGTVPAALTAYLAIQAFQPDLVLSMGTAGGFAARGAAIGDVFVGASVINHDRRIQIPVSKGGCRTLKPHCTQNPKVFVSEGTRIFWVCV